MPRNPSELARLEEELDALRKDMNPLWPKAQREGWLREIRVLERILGIESKPYNGG
jgi:hypothetical protein